MMKKTTLLKVLVVYSSKIASSAQSNKFGNTNPFALAGGRAGYAQSYAYFLDACKKQNIQAALSTSDDITGPGTCKSFWTHDEQGWRKVKSPCFSFNIFDKFSPTDRKLKGKRELMFQNPKIKPFNSQSLYETFFDKYKTYLSLSKFAIPTVKIDGKLSGGSLTALNELRELIRLSGNMNDFEDSYVLKDRNGAGGNQVYKIMGDKEIEIEKILSDHSKNTYILQPMIAFDHGFQYKGKDVRTDIRIIFMGNKIVQTYVRIAAPNEFRCNDHQGGSLHHLEISEIPNKVIKMAKEIERILPPHDSLYALDFVISNSGTPYFLEGNTGPGLDWKPEDKIEEAKSKQLIRMIVKKLAQRTRVNRRGIDGARERIAKLSYQFNG